MEERTRKFTVKTKDGHLLSLIEYSFPMEMSASSEKNQIINIDRYTTEDGRTVEKINKGYQILGEEELYYDQ